MKNSDTHPSRIFRYCPRCGHNSLIFDGEKAFNCEACGFRYYINASAAVAAILTLPDGTIILTRRRHEPRQGTLDLPGGFVDLDERAEDALRREVKEELNLTVSHMKFLATFPNQYVYRGITYFTIDMAFICPIADISGLTPADDVSEAVIVRPDEIDYESISFPSIVSILRKYEKMTDDQ